MVIQCTYKYVYRTVIIPFKWLLLTLIPKRMVSIRIKNGFRYVKPYYHKNRIFVKGRWVGKPLLDVLVKEFRSFDKDYYTRAIFDGKYKLYRDGIELPLFSATSPLSSNLIINNNIIIRSGDILETIIHKHEPPIKYWLDVSKDQCIIKNDRFIDGISVVFEDNNLIVVDKPCGIPVHPTGGYYYNTLTEVIRHSLTLYTTNNNSSIEIDTNLYPCHRLDKVTSGVTILAKNKQMANIIQTGIQSHNMQKLYLARVHGKFPGSVVINNNNNNNNINNKQPLSLTDRLNINLDSNCLIKCDSPIYTVQIKKQFPNGLGSSRPAETIIYPYWYDMATNQSVVICKPLTGRTHQIRIHLLRLGYPIVNDTLYCSQVTKYPLYLDFIRKYEAWEECPNRDQLAADFDQLIKEATDVRQSRLVSLRKSDRGLTCDKCELPLMEDPEDFTDMVLYLHAWKYYQIDFSSFNDKYGSFETRLPFWAVASQ